jgi:hypothetical protein
VDGSLGGFGRKALFWDVSRNEIDFERHRRWVVARVLSYGTWEEILAVFGTYGVAGVREALTDNRFLDPDTARFWREFAPGEEAATAVFHPEVLEPATRRLLEEHGPDLAQPGFALCGGTAISLRYGHRQSDDLDLLTMADFDSGALFELLASRLTVQLVDRRPNTLHVTASGVKLTYLKQAGIRIESRGEIFGVPVASDGSLAVLKANAVAGRGSRKDFVDLHEMFRRGMTMDALVQEVEARAPSLNRRIVLRSLTYFRDADAEPMPRMLSDASWEEVKRELEAVVRNYVKREVYGPHF